ncbi:MAG: SGNH/GDSL hydrolase family protein [Candidatus Aminicenantes bacterium]|nr:SGNH/GDSL hydrolase family protein [Candidatus Aminicenantes bacterium]
MIDKKSIAVFVLIIAAASWLAAGDRPFLVEQFEFQGRTYSVKAATRQGQTDLILQEKRGTDLSAGMGGDNVLLGTRIGGNNFYVFWLNYRRQSLRLAYYDHRQRRSRVLPLEGFAYFGLPEILEEEGGLRALVFLGDNSDNVDIFYYELAPRSLIALTRTPYSEKEMIVRENEGGLEIETRSLWGKFQYRFDRRSRQTQLLAATRLSPPRKRPERVAIDATPEYYNTYIGFGDSITWGQIEAVRRLDLCYLTQMRDTYLPLNYGPAYPINLGVIGDETREAILHVDQDLDDNPAFYFLLMLGFNDVWKRDFSLASSIENLEYIIDAALELNMRVIVSTLTPRKDALFNTTIHWNRLYSFSAAILDLAKKKGVGSIDTLSAFMNTNPPNGWKDLLETPGIVVVGGEEIYVKGNHPNGAGHSLIASLFADALAAFPPLPPRNISVIDFPERHQRTAFWDVNPESDFSHFHVEFGFSPEDLRYKQNTGNAYQTFNLFPFLPQLHFRVQTVDRNNRQSDFSVPGTTASTSEPQPGRNK